MNIFISIIEEAYISSKTRDKNHWIYSYLKVDPQFVDIQSGENKKLDKLEDYDKKIQEFEDFESKENKNTNFGKDNLDLKQPLYKKEYKNVKKLINKNQVIKDIMNLDKNEHEIESKNNDEIKEVNINDLDETKKEINERFKIIDSAFDQVSEIIIDINKSKNNSTQEFKETVNKNFNYLNEKLKEMMNSWVENEK
jgi:hypothetical protein